MAITDERRFQLVAVCVAVTLACAWGVQWTARGAAREPVPGQPAAPLDRLVPLQLAGATARSVPVSQGVFDRLAAAGYLFREYTDGDGAVVWLWIGYYDNQRDATVHSPRGCYRGSGWIATVDRNVSAEDAPVEWPLRWLRVRRESEERLVLYWYETAYGPVASELQRNLHRLRGRIGGNTALFFVRLSTPVGGGADDASRLLRMARAVRQALGAHVAAAPGTPLRVKAEG